MRALTLALVLLAPCVALAQDPPLAPNATVLDPIIITARPQRPAAFYLLTRSRPRFERADTERHAVDRIVDSVTRAPF